MKKMNKKGFTIVELSIVIAVIAILSAVLIPTFTGIVNKSKKSAAAQRADSALTVIIGEEDAQLNPGATYYFIVDDYWFSYTTETKVLEEVKENDVPASTKAVAGDTVYAAQEPTFNGTDTYTLGVITSDKEDIMVEGVDTGDKPVATFVTSEDLAEDLGDIIVWVKAN